MELGYCIFEWSVEVMTIPGNIHLTEYAHAAYGIWDMGNGEEEE